MISAAQFKRNVSHRGMFGKMKSPGRIMFIHAALEAYETAKLQNAARLQQLAYLYEVAKQGKNWMKEKQGKSSANTASRRMQVESLMREIAAEMSTKFPDVWRALSAFSANKQAFNGNGAAQGPKEVYAHEKTIYNENKANGMYRPGDMRMTASATKMDSSFYGAREFQPLVDRGIKFTELNEAQFRELDRICMGQQTMLYMSKIQRLQHMLLIDGGLLKWPDGRLITLLPQSCVLDELDRCIYAVDKYGNFFVTVELKGLQQNHTTLCAGGEVICAGNLSIKNGRLRAISNNSGHYKPDRERLKEAVQLLADAGVAMDGVLVVDASPKQRGGTEVEIMAKSFLQGGGAAVPAAMAKQLLAAKN